MLKHGARGGPRGSISWPDDYQAVGKHWEGQARVMAHDGCCHLTGAGAGHFRGKAV
jgi:hypothetical protein